MPRYSRSRSRSRSRTPPRRRGRRSYSNSGRSRSASTSRSGSKHHHKKTTTGAPYSRSPRKDPPRRGSGYKNPYPRQKMRRSRSYSPEKRRYGGPDAKAKSRSPEASGRYKTPPRAHDKARSYRQGEASIQPRDGYADQSGYGQPKDVEATEKEGSKYEAVSPEDLRFTPKLAARNNSPYNRKASKRKVETNPSAQYYQPPDQPPSRGQQVAAALQKTPQIIRPIVDPYAVKIPRRKDEGLTPIFDRPELKVQPEQEANNPPVLPPPAMASQGQEPVLYRQDVRFTGPIPVGGPPPPPHFMEPRRDHVMMTSYETQQREQPYLNAAGPPPFGPNLLPTGPPPPLPLYQGPPPIYQPQHMDPFQKGPAEPIGGYRQPTASSYLPSMPPQLQTNLGEGVSYQYPPPGESIDSMPKGPHDLRYDLESRRKMSERLTRSRSRSRGRSVSRSRSPPARQPYKSTYQRSRSRSRDRSDSGDRRPVRERLGKMSKRNRSESFSDDSGSNSNWRDQQSSYNYVNNNNRDRDNRSKSRDKPTATTTTTKYRSRGTTSGATTSSFRGRGYLGKNFIPGYKRGMGRGMSYNSKFNQQRGGTGGYQGRGIGRGNYGHGRWTHDMFDKDKDKNEVRQGGGDDKTKKMKKDAKDKDKKKSKKVKKSKKSPSHTDTSGALQGIPSNVNDQ